MDVVLAEADVSSWLMWGVGLLVAAITASVGWLVKEVLDLRTRLAVVEASVAGMKVNCERHQKWNEDTQRSLGRVDRNLVRLCQHAKIEFDAPE